jgi:hypothetical protein
MPRRHPRNPFRTRGGAAAPKPIKVVAPKLDTTGLEAAYEWFPVDQKTAFKLAFEWFDANLTTLLYGDPLDEERQKLYNKAVKTRSQGDHTDFPEESLTAWNTTVNFYERVWPNKNLPSIREAIANTAVSKRVENIRTVISSLNGAFSGLVTFRMTFSSAREYQSSEILVPKDELEKMIPMTPLKIALTEVPTVAKVVSIVTDDEGNQSLDGEQFMKTLPQLLDSVAGWAAGDKEAIKAIGKAPAVKAAAAASNGQPRTSAPRVTVKGGTITVVDATRMPDIAGKRRQSVELTLNTATVAELKAALVAAGLPTYLGYAVKTATDAGMISVTP